MPSNLTTTHSGYRQIELEQLCARQERAIADRDHQIAELRQSIDSLRATHRKHVENIALKAQQERYLEANVRRLAK